jgi:L-fucose mutarotase/ribose pyranase (RbsD/FucU family)
MSSWAGDDIVIVDANFPGQAVAWNAYASERLNELLEVYSIESKDSFSQALNYIVVSMICEFAVLF